MSDGISRYHVSEPDTQDHEVSGTQAFHIRPGSMQTEIEHRSKRNKTDVLFSVNV